jgi:Zn-dependent protease
MFKSWRLGTLLGFPVEVNLSFLLLLAVVYFAFGGAIGVFVVLLAFASVVLHELGHALVARKLGVHVAGIELSFFGGAAKMVQIPRTARHEIAIAAAGPAVSLVLGGLGFGLGTALHVPLLSMIGWINFVIAAFNLIPALPMDGGRILRAALTYKMDFVRATDVSVYVARVFTVLFALYGLATGAFQLVVLAPFLWMMSTREKMMARMMADQYAGFGRYGDQPEVLHRDAWDDRGGAHRPFFYGGEPNVRRFRIVQRGGRLVVEALD